MSTCNSLPICNLQHIKNISQGKARAPGVLPKVVATVVCMACIAVASASSIMSLAWVILRGRLVCTSVLSTLVTIWCILSQIALDCGFLLVEPTFLMLKIANSHWKFCSMNSPPLSCRHCIGWGYQQTLYELVTYVFGWLVINANQFD